MLEALQTAFAKGELRLFNTYTHLNQPDAFTRYLEPLRHSEWVVYAQPSFGGPQQVLEYLGRYTHRVAISNQRLLATEDDQVTFQWKDYRHPQRPKTLTLEPGEFIRRFLLHTLPSGLTAHSTLRVSVELASPPSITMLPRTLAESRHCFAPKPQRDYRDLYQSLTAIDLNRCPKCNGILFVIEVLPACRYSQREDSS